MQLAQEYIISLDTYTHYRERNYNIQHTGEYSKASVKPIKGKTHQQCGFANVGLKKREPTEEKKGAVEH